MGGFSLLLDALRVWTSASSLFWARFTFFFFCRALDFGSRVGFGARSRRILGPVAVDDEGGRARCRDDQPAVPRLRRRDGAPAIFLHPVRTSELATRAGARHELGDHAGGTRGAVAKRMTRAQGSHFLFFSLGFVCK